ncbi:MAG: Gfo/Idh/MocA family oxidoreductase [Acidisphaera sp.]|nr:Gfo/Idh/MocA family oxidoreductase [Acidisphaera sp.]
MTRRLALLGAGLIGREHAALVAAHPGAELVGIADTSPAAREHASALGVPFCADYASMLDQVRPDGAIVALPNHLHVPAGLACVERGIPCLVEKPVAESVEAAQRLVAASERRGVPVLVGHHRRHSPDISEARRIVRDGLLGDLVAVNGMCWFDKPDAYFEAEWRRGEGGGPLLINLIHDVDTLRFICGEIDSVCAFTANAVRGFPVEDTAGLAIRFESGVLGTFSVSDAVASPWSWEFTSAQALYFPHQPGAYLFFGGRTGSLSVSDMYLWRHADTGGHWQDPLIREHRPLDRSRAYVNQLEHFLAVIAGTATPAITARDGMLTLAATLAVAASARDHRTVSVREIAAP